MASESRAVLCFRPSASRRAGRTSCAGGLGREQRAQSQRPHPLEHLRRRRAPDPQLVVDQLEQRVRVGRIDADDLEVALQVGARQTERPRRGERGSRPPAGWPGGCRSRRRRAGRAAVVRGETQWDGAEEPVEDGPDRHGVVHPLCRRMLPRRSSSPASPPSHRLRMQIQQPGIRVVPRLDLPVGRAAVERPK